VNISSHHQQAGFWYNFHICPFYPEHPNKLLTLNQRPIWYPYTSLEDSERTIGIWDAYCQLSASQRPDFGYIQSPRPTATNFGIIQENNIAIAYGFKLRDYVLPWQTKIYEIADIHGGTLKQTRRNDWHHFRGQCLLCLLSGAMLHG
jgi:hypothetical protein